MTKGLRSRVPSESFRISSDRFLHCLEELLHITRCSFGHETLWSMCANFHELFSRSHFEFWELLIYLWWDGYISNGRWGWKSSFMPDFFVLEDTQFPRSVLHHISRGKTGILMVKSSYMCSISHCTRFLKYVHLGFCRWMKCSFLLYDAWVSDWCFPYDNEFDDHLEFHSINLYVVLW